MSPPRPLANRACHVLWLCMTMLIAHSAHAKCNLTGVTNTQTIAGTIIKLNFGHINLTSAPLQPDGTPLARIAVPATNYTYNGAHPDSVLWECDKQDLGSIYFMVATNGDYVYGGMHEVGKTEKLTDVYRTQFAHVGLHLSMKGVALAKKWRPLPRLQEGEYLPFGEEDKDGNVKERIAIRLRDVPVMEATLYKVSDKLGRAPTGASRISSAVLEPNGYIQLVGPGLLHDEPDDDSQTKFLFYSGNNGLGYGMYNNATSVSQVATCVANVLTPHVPLGTITVQQLHEPPESAASAPFSIEVDCNGGPKISGTENNQTALGLQASAGAFAAAKTLELVSPEGGVEYLLSDQYGMPGIAQGVGIRVYDGDGEQRWFVGQPGTVGAGHPHGNLAGWYPVLKGVSGDAKNLPSGIRRRRLDFTAKLVKLPKQDITPGKISATAHVLVKVQ